MRGIVRWWKHRPRVVSHDDYMKLRRQFPAEQRARQGLLNGIRKLQARYLVERARHRLKVADCESLKALLDADTLTCWKRDRAIAAATTPEEKLFAILRPHLEAMSDEELAARITATQKILAEWGREEGGMGMGKAPINTERLSREQPSMRGWVLGGRKPSA